MEHEYQDREWKVNGGLWLQRNKQKTWVLRFNVGFEA